MSAVGTVPLLLGAIAGCLGILAARDLFESSAGIADWVREAIEPLRRARGEGYLPTSAERFRLGVLGGVGAILAGGYLGGPSIALPMAVAGPFIAGWLVQRSRARYRRAIERSLPEVARVIADGLSAGHSPRGALAAVAASLDGPPSREFEKVTHSLELGHPTVGAIRAMADRFSSARVDAFATALVSQRTAGGDLAALLRRFADGAAERDRVAEDARSATAQARFTGYLVAAMPIGAALFTELIAPGFIGSLAGSPVSLLMVVVAAAFQAGGFVTISKLAKVGEF